MVFTETHCILIVLLIDEFHVLIFEFHCYAGRSKDKKNYEK